MKLKQQLLAILDEAFDRPPTPWAHFTDSDGTSSYFTTLDNLNADQAQQNDGTTSIAAQTKHVIFILYVTNSILKGHSVSPGPKQWQESWELQKLDALAWDRMRVSLRAGYAEIRDTIAQIEVMDESNFSTVVGVVAHVAYHLGAIRSKFARILVCDSYSGGNVNAPRQQ